MRSRVIIQADIDAHKAFAENAKAEGRILSPEFHEEIGRLEIELDAATATEDPGLAYQRMLEDLATHISKNTPRYEVVEG